MRVPAAAAPAKNVRAVFICWVIAFGLVGAQMSWYCGPSSARRTGRSSGFDQENPTSSKLWAALSKNYSSSDVMIRFLEHVRLILQAPAGGDVRDLASCGIGLRTGVTLLVDSSTGAAMGSFGVVFGEHYWQVVISAVKVPFCFWRRSRSACRASLF